MYLFAISMNLVADLPVKDAKTDQYVHQNNWSLF